jgi:hypothetical protein
MAQPTPRDQGERPDRGWTRWLAAGTFVLGLAAGVLLVGLLGQDPPPPTTAGGPATSEPAGRATSPAEPTGRVEVNAACLRALNAAQDIAGTVDDLGAAAAVLDAAQLDEVIRRLQPLQARLEENTAACEATGTVATAPPTAPPAVPPSPSASPSPSD